MAELINSLSAVALVLMMAAVGYLCGALGWLKHEHKGFLVKLIVNICVPLMCFENLFSSVTPEMLRGSEKLFLVIALTLSLTFGVSLLLAKLFRIEHKRFGGFVVMCALSNSMFVGLPMCVELFGVEATPYVMMFYIVNTSFFWTLGVLLLKRSGLDKDVRVSARDTVKGIFNPPLISLALSAVLLLAGFEPPHLLMSFSQYMGRLVTPLSLVYVGFALYETGLKSLRLDKTMIVVLVMRFAFAPLLALGLCHLFGITGIQRGVITIDAAMPVMVQSVVVSSSAGADEAYQAAGLSISTLACFVAIPLLMFLV